MGFTPWQFMMLHAPCEEREEIPVGEKKAGQSVPIRNYQDTVFRMLFQEKRELLSLFNAIHGTSYDEPEKLEITTLENAVYMAMKNDISCVLDLQMDLYEHQSTPNPNMPLRDLFYVSKLLENWTKDQNLYAGQRIQLPVPKFVVFYNGESPQPERREYRLSESFARRGEEINLELVVLQLNINPGYNTEIVENCPTLLEYIQYTDRVRHYKKEQPLAEAVERAVSECIEEGILTDFLRKNKSEVIPMSIFEYDAEKHMCAVREEGREEGLEQGNRQSALRMIEAGKLSPAEIALYSDLSLEQVLELEKELQLV